ncbi:AMP-binding protein [Nocardia sp. NRRL WC-3656]|uniref:AMP-binding protein n=1 Tax=Nocardia sp. NRRL WC-3656 TaxID=1463824 RepID=UPI0004C44CCB|nr:AMP-binding protein [Nocardia sp. NRRL WC-3656]
MWGTLPRLMQRVTADHRDRTALIDGDRSLTYTELAAATNRVSNGLLAAGLRPGDRVGVLMPNCLEYIPTIYGIWGAGGVVTQMPARASASDFRYFLGSAAATTLIHHDSFDTALTGIRDDCPALDTVIRLGSRPSGDDILDYTAVFEEADSAAPRLQIEDSDLAFIGFTSGTTGIPKGVLQSHATWLHYSVTAGLEIGDTRPGEVFAHGAPLTHFTQTFIMPTLMRGGTNLILPGLDIDTLLTAVSTHKVTATAVVPTIIYLLLARTDLTDYDLSSLRTIIYAGSPMAPSELDHALRVFGPIFAQAYAGTEPGYISCLRKHDHQTETPAQRARLASAGRPMYHVDLDIRDDTDHPMPTGQPGEIWVRQAGQMTGYLDPALNTDTIHDGWVRTGDIGYLDHDGFLFIVDRKKDMIITGGFNVFPRQIEDVLDTHPAVRHSAVIGIPDPKWGEAVHAYIVTDSENPVTADEIIQLVRDAKGSVWAPKSIELVTDLPLNPSGKVDKKTLRQRHWDGQARQVH